MSCGDGFLYEVLNSLEALPKAVAVVPSGTGNGVATSLGIRGPVEAAAAGGIASTGSTPRDLSPAPRVTPEKNDAPAQRSAFLRPPPTMQRWNVEMRQALSVDVSKLPPSCLNDVVKIVLKRQPENGAEVTIDFNTISEPVCDELRAFVEKSRAESTAKATLASCADGGPCPWIKKEDAPPPPPSSDRPYFLYAAVAVAAVAAIVVMRRR